MQKPGPLCTQKDPSSCLRKYELRWTGGGGHPVKVPGPEARLPVTHQGLSGGLNNKTEQILDELGRYTEERWLDTKSSNARKLAVIMCTPATMVVFVTHSRVPPRASHDQSPSPGCCRLPTGTLDSHSPSRMGLLPPFLTQKLQRTPRWT